MTAGQVLDQRLPLRRESRAANKPYAAILFDRDGTLIVNVPYNGDPQAVTPMPHARAALNRLRTSGLQLGVITNQSGLARGRFTGRQLTAVNARVEHLLGPFDTWQICPHDDAARCHCRKPQPGLVHAAATALGIVPSRCVVIGDRGRDIAAAIAATATGVLVPTTATPHAEVEAAPAVAASLNIAADLVLKAVSANIARHYGGPPAAAATSAAHVGTNGDSQSERRQAKAEEPARKASVL